LTGMSNFVSVIFCRICGSRFVEIAEWSRDGLAVISCRSCGNKDYVKNFTLGRARVSSAELENARNSRAKKGRYEK